MSFNEATVLLDISKEMSNVKCTIRSEIFFLFAIIKKPSAKGYRDQSLFWGGGGLLSKEVFKYICDLVMGLEKKLILLRDEIALVRDELDLRVIMLLYSVKSWVWVEAVR